LKTKVIPSLQYGDLLQHAGSIYPYFLEVKKGERKAPAGVEELLRALPPDALAKYALRLALADSED